MRGWTLYLIDRRRLGGVVRALSRNSTPSRPRWTVRPENVRGFASRAAAKAYRKHLRAEPFYAIIIEEL